MDVEEPWVWTCGACKNIVPIPESTRARRVQGERWTKVSAWCHLCPQCTRSANRDCSKASSHVPDMKDPRQREEQ
eukprot:9503731-Lingulodinium_polyedra.AAC.1